MKVGFAIINEDVYVKRADLIGFIQHQRRIAVALETNDVLNNLVSQLMKPTLPSKPPN